MKKKKILFVTATLEAGGVGNVLSNLSLQLQDRYDITILLNDTERIVFPYGGKVISLGMRQQDNRMSLWYQMKVFVRRFIKLYRLKRSEEYDVCISMLDSANVANILSGKKKCKVITTVYTNISAAKYERANRFIIIPAIKCLYNKSDFIVVTSEGVKKDLETNYGLKAEIMRVIYDGVDIKRIHQDMLLHDNIDKYNIQDRIVISTLGRLDTAKGQWHLIRAMKKVVQMCPTAKLLIMGSGYLESSLKALVKECQLEDYVEICGFVENPYQYIEQSKLFVLSSIVEGYPTVLLEALVCGKICVSTDFDSGAREILAPNTDVCFKQIQGVELAEYGILTPVCDGKVRDGYQPLTQEEIMLADGIIEGLTNEDVRRNYTNKIQSYSEHFSIENCTQEWIKVLEKQFVKG